MERLYNSLLIYDKTQLFMYHVGKYTIPTGSYMGIVKLRQTGRMVLLTMPSTSVLVHLGQVKQWWSSLRAVFKKKLGNILVFLGAQESSSCFQKSDLPKTPRFCCRRCFLLCVFWEPIVLKCRCLWRDEPTKKGHQEGKPSRPGLSGSCPPVCRIHMSSEKKICRVYRGLNYTVKRGLWGNHYKAPY